MRSGADKTPLTHRYAVAAVAVLGGLALRYALAALLGPTVPYLTFFPAIMIAAWFGGLGPGLVATALSLLAAVYFVMEPRYSWQVQSPGDWASLFVFCGVGAIISVLNEALRRSRARAEERLAQLEMETRLRAHAEQEVASSRRHLSAILESISDAFIALNRDSCFTYVNAEAERILGRAKADLLGRNCWKEYPAAREIAVERGYGHGDAGHAPIRFEQYFAPNRTWFEVHAYPATDGGWSVYFRDITARRNTEAALQAAQRETERARDTLDVTLRSIGDAVIATDAEGRVTFLNQVAQELTGWTAADAAGQSLAAVFVIRNEATDEVVENPVSKVLREGRTVGLANHTILIRRDGVRIPIDDSAAPMRDDQGQIIGVVLVFRDVSERRAGEAAVANTANRLRLALEAGRIGVWDWDIRRNLIEWTERVYDIHGVEPGTPPGGVEEFVNLIHPADRERVGASIREVLEKDLPYEVEFRVVHPNHEVHWISTTAQVYRDSSGTAIRMLGATTDVTERKRSEEMSRRAHEDLQQFTYAAGHDLKEPLRTVTSYVQLIARRYRESFDQDGKELIGFALDGARRMGLLVEALLEYSRAGEGNQAIEAVSAETALQDTLSSLHMTTVEANAEITYDPLPQVMVDQLHLSQLFQNLIVNAIKYRRAGQAPQIHVGAQTGERECVFFVRDNGIGIAPKYHATIFGVFKRLHGSEIAGTGIGLATCKKIVGRYGGRIWVESSAGEGATFFFTLPPAAGKCADHAAP